MAENAKTQMEDVSHIQTDFVTATQIGHVKTMFKVMCDASPRLSIVGILAMVVYLLNYAQILVAKSTFRKLLEILNLKVIVFAFVHVYYPVNQFKVKRVYENARESLGEN